MSRTTSTRSAWLVALAAFTSACSGSGSSGSVGATDGGGAAGTGQGGASGSSAGASGSAGTGGSSGASGSAGVSGAGGGPPCGYEQVRCGPACTTLSDDPVNCGACGNACPADRPFCDGQECVPPRPGPHFIWCDGAWVDGADPAHCGSCTRHCTGATPVCLDASECIAGCVNASWPVRCGDVCGTTQLWADPNRCADCDTACDAKTEVCRYGAGCEPCEQALHHAMCDGECKNLFDDRYNCGSCGAICPSDAPYCVNTRCKACPDTYQELCGGVCIDVHGDDAAHCGDCDTKCAPSEICCSGNCMAECPR